MLKFVDEICRREKLTYWLAYGTLLGAVRHKGFIPWDDDVDLMMPRPDYEKLVDAAQRLSNGHYAFFHPRLREDYAQSWIRVYDLGTRVELSKKLKYSPTNLFMDIFPVDALPSNPLLSKLFFLRVRLRHILLKCSRKIGVWKGERLPILKKVIAAVTSRLPSALYARLLDRFCAQGNFETAEFVGVCALTNYGARERLPKSVFRDTVRLSFCDGEYPAPVDWDVYLKAHYGDYMQLPPEEERVPKHKMRATITD